MSRQKTIQEPHDGSPQADMSGTVRRIFASATVVDWSQFEGGGAVRCTVGVSVPLILGLVTGQPGHGVFGAAGAVSVGFGSFQGAYRSRAAVMLFSAAGMAMSIFVGSLAGHTDAGAVAAAGAGGFLGGFVVSVGPAATFVGLQSMVGLLVAGGYPADFADAAGRAALVFAGGLLQTLLVVMIWPLRRFSAERRSLAAAYRSLAQYAAGVPATAAAPEPHTFAATASPLVDPQPFARSGDLLAFQALLDEAERIRGSLAGLATQHRRLTDSDQSCAAAISGLLEVALAEIAAALEQGREPREPPGLWASLDECARQLSTVTAVNSLLGQLRAAWRTAGALTGAAAPDAATARVARVVPVRRRPPVREALITLRANLAFDSTACRHALRLGATLAIATMAYRVFELPRGYWVPLTALLVLKPEFQDTFTRGIGRIGGTLLGAGCATIIERALSPGPVVLAALVLGFVCAGFALVRTSYAIFTVCITGYVVFLLMLAGVPELTVATDRIVYTAAGGLFALFVYGVWPTWTAGEVRPALAGLLEAHSRYVEALLAGYAEPDRVDLGALADIRNEGRLTRSNVEAIVERMLGEPVTTHSLAASTAVGLLAAIRRHALAALALHAGLERRPAEPVRGIGELSRQMAESLAVLAAALRSATAPPPLPPLRETQLALNADGNDLVCDETDLMVDSIRTIASLLARDVEERGAGGDGPR